MMDATFLQEALNLPVSYSIFSRKYSKAANHSTWFGVFNIRTCSSGFVMHHGLEFCSMVVSEAF